MLNKVKSHNEVNGFRFSAGEFSLMALVIAPFGIYYFAHGRPFAGLVAAGIVANTVVVAALSLHALFSGQKDIGVSRWFDKDGRAMIASRFPNMTRDTMILTVVTLLPFVLLLSVLVESRPRTLR